MNIDKNQVEIIGKIVSKMVFSHKIYKRNFYVVNVLIKRSGTSEDIIPVMLSNKILDVTQNYEGKCVRISGEFRSHNQHEGNKNHLVLYVFVQELNFMDEEDDFINSNHIFLDGHICKPPVYRNTSHGREITDLLIAVNRPYGKSDYIPCICWGRNAWDSAFLNVGDRIKVSGRIQSREYMKRISDAEQETRIAYEVSVKTISVIDSV